MKLTETTFPQNLNPDVIIVGSGICGALLANKLLKQGVSVLMLEAGARYDRGQIVENYRAQSIASKAAGDMTSLYPGTAETHNTNFTPNHSHDYLILQGRDPGAYHQSIIRGVGGTTWHWAASSWRMVPSDMKMKTKYGVGLDFPISYDDLEPYYYEAELEMGVMGPNGQDIRNSAPRKQPWPMDSMPNGYSDATFTQIVEKLGWQNAPTPQARNSRPYDGRPQCAGNNNCMPICPIGAMYNAAQTVTKVEQQGGIVLDEATAYSFDTDKDNKITAVHFFDSEGKSYTAKAKIFVIAGNGIETPKLLLNSANDRNPHGLANSSDQVGRNLTDHAAYRISFLAKEPMWGGQAATQMTSILEFRDGDFRKDHAAFQIGYNNFNPVPKATLKVLSEGHVGKELDRAIRDRAARSFNIHSNHETLADPNNRLTLSTDLKDKLGIPRPVIYYDVGEHVRKSLPVAREKCMQLAKEMGGTEIEEFYWGPNNHIMGGTIMGTDPSKSVTDGYCRTHDHSNLFLATGAVMPATGTQNSTLSMAALSLRAADAILNELHHG